MWGGIFGQERTRLVIINGNLTTQHHIDDILCPTDLLFLQQQPSGVIYQHDNARPHSQNGTKYQYALTCMLTRYDLNGTHMGCHRLWCLELLWDVTGHGVWNSYGMSQILVFELLWDVTDLGVWNSYGMSQIMVFGTPTGCHRSWCSTTSKPSSKPTTTDTYPTRHMTFYQCIREFLYKLWHRAVTHAINLICH